MGIQHNSLPASSSRRADPPARQPFYFHAACWQLPPPALLKNPAGHAHSRAHGGPICCTSPCTARKTLGSARCQVCCCPAAAPVQEGDVPAGEGLSLVPMHTPGDSPPAPMPGRSPTISPTGLPASSLLRRSTPCSGAAASRRTPPSLGHALPPRCRPRPGVSCWRGDAERRAPTAPVQPVAAGAALSPHCATWASSLKIDGISCPGGGEK